MRQRMRWYNVDPVLEGWKLWAKGNFHCIDVDFHFHWDWRSSMIQSARKGTLRDAQWKSIRGNVSWRATRKLPCRYISLQQSAPDTVVSPPSKVKGKLTVSDRSLLRFYPFDAISFPLQQILASSQNNRTNKHKQCLVARHLCVFGQKQVK